MKRIWGQMIAGLMALCLTAGTVTHARGAVVNTASESYTDASSVARTYYSNTVNATVVSAPSIINYYSDATFTVVVNFSTLGLPLYVEGKADVCNMSATTVETRTIVLTSALTGDTESFTATETGANTGVFQILAGVPTSGGAPVIGNGILETRRNDVVAAQMIDCGGTTVRTIIYIDPAGVVFDSTTNAPIAGATVTLIDVTGGGNGIPAVPGLACAAGTPGAAAKVMNSSATAILPSTVVTGADGRYEFPVVCPSSYRLVVTPPPGYRTPSAVPPASLPPGRTINATGSYGGSFPVDLTTGATFVDIPADPLSGGFFIKKTASRDSAEIGDFVDYTVEIRNSTGAPLAAVTVKDRLAFGFVYEPGTARLGGVPVADPAGGRGPNLTFAVGAVANGTTAKLTYRAKLGPGALQGDGINRAQGFAAGGQQSNRASAQVKVLPGVFTDRAYIIGKVFTDCNRNRIQDPEEIGIPGVRIYMEDGTFVITDSEGKYSFYGVLPRTHVLKLDETTLPPGSELITLSNRNAGDAGSRFVDLKNGELHKADFAEGSCNDEVMKEVRRRRYKGEVVVAETDKAVATKLSRDPMQEKSSSDLRSQPATGFVGADPKGGGSFDPLYRDVSTEMFRPDPRITAPIIDLEDEVQGMDNSFGFVDLKDGDTLPIPQLHVRVKGAAGGSFRLVVNGDEIPASRVGKKMKVNETGFEAWEYIGIDLRPGRNELALSWLDSFGNARESRTIHVTAPDKLGKIIVKFPQSDLVADGHTPVRIAVKLTDDKGVPVTYRTQLTLEASLGRWQVEDMDKKEPGVQTFVEGGSAEFVLLPPQEAGEAVVRISSGVLDTKVKLDFLPDLRPLIAAGVLEGIINARHLSPSSILGTTPQDGFERELHSNTFSSGPVDGGVRGAFFLKGKVKGEYLLTVAFDSDKETKERMFRDIQPDEFYPIYGDSSVRGYDAQSTGKLYVRIDKRKSYLLYGDFTTQGGASDVRQLGAYSRSLNGLKWHVEDGTTNFNAFASDDSTRRIIDELPAKGISGPYYITNIMDFVVNSEKVEIITRSRNQPSIIIRSVPMTRFADYMIDSFSGSIMFKSPVPMLDADLNQNSIRVTYEVKQGGSTFWIAGADVQKKLTDRFEVGGSFVRDNNPLDRYELGSANFTAKLAEKTFLIGEWAQSRSDTSGLGDAKRFELIHDDGRLKGRVHASQTDTSFNNPSSSFGKGRLEAGGKFSYKLDSAYSLTGDVMHTEDELSGGRRDGANVNIERVFSKNLRAEIGARYAAEGTTPSGTSSIGITPYEYTSLRSKVNLQVPDHPQLGFMGEYEQVVSAGDRKMLTLGSDYQITNKTRAYARQQFMDSLAGTYALNNTQQQNATLVGVESEYMKDGHLFSEYRVRDASNGRDTEAAVGLRNIWNVAQGLRLNTGFERVEVLNGPTDARATAVTAGADYTANPLWKGSTQFEYRTSTSSESFLNTIGASYKFSREITLLARNLLSTTDTTGTSGDKFQERIQAGFAYRPVDTNVWNSLHKYEFKYETEQRAADDTLRRQVHILSNHLNVQPVRPLVISGLYAVKYVRDEAAGISSTSSNHLVSGRVTYDITNRWDAGVMACSLFDGSFRSNAYGSGIEVGYLVAANLWISGGYNFMGFYDKDLADQDYLYPGVYIRLRFKFDENLLASGDPRANKTLVPDKPQGASLPQK